MNTSALTLNVPRPVQAAPKRGRMTLDGGTKGRIDNPLRILIYGGEKIGKSTWCASAPGAKFLGSDNGTSELDVDRFPQPESWSDVLEALDIMATAGKSKGYQTLVIDPLNWFEPLAVADVLGNTGKTLDRWDGGYGRGVNAVNDRWRVMHKYIERVWKAGIGVILAAHASVGKFKNPEGDDFMRYEIAINEKAAGLFKQWVDCILFANRKVFTKEDAGGRMKGFASSAHILSTRNTAAYDAGNRWNLPPELPMSWAALMAAREAGKTSAAENQTRLLAQIEAGLAELADPAAEAKVREWLAVPDANLVEIANAIEAKVGQLRADGAPEA